VDLEGHLIDFAQRVSQARKGMGIPCQISRRSHIAEGYYEEM
jgi:hypothetical protein